MLSAIGINVKYHTVVGDNPDRLRDCVEIARKRADIIVTTGGLGPTYDDLTKSLLAESFGLKLVRDEKEYALMQAYANERHRAMPNVFMQSMLPEGCTVFHNTCGTAPGCAFEKDGTIVIMLPGPPRECSTMFRLSAIPYLKKLSDEQIVSHAIRIFGKGEFEVDGIFREEMDNFGYNREANQYFAALSNMRSVGCMGDERTYDYAVVLRAVTTTDFMTAESAELPWELLSKVTNRIVNEVKGVNRVMYDLTGKPPATIELE